MKHCKVSGQDRNEARYVEGGKSMSTQSSNGRLDIDKWILTNGKSPVTIKK